jgi:hypothetical protein
VRLRFAWLIAAAALATAGPAEGARAEYLGGTLPELSIGSKGVLRTTDATALLFTTTRKQTIRVPYDSILQLEYGQKVDRRLIEGVLISPLFLLSKTRKHFLSISYRGEDDRQEALVFRMEKDLVRAVLVALETRSGRKIQYQDEEARKAGKG